MPQPDDGVHTSQLRPVGDDGGYPDVFETGSADQVTITNPDASPVVAYDDAGTLCYWGTTVYPSGKQQPGYMCPSEIQCAQQYGCFVIGAHGSPTGQVTCLPPAGTVPSGSTCVLSICYAGINGAAQCVQMQQNLDAGSIIACTGNVYVGRNGQLSCQGCWVDGNGNTLACPDGGGKVPLADSGVLPLPEDVFAPEPDASLPEYIPVDEAGITWCDGGC